LSLIDAEDVLTLIGVLERRRLSYWIAGGWGVDALLGRITRDHHDLDLHIDLSELEDVVSLLAGLGYSRTIDQPPVRIEMTHPSGKVVDLHPLRIASDGSGSGPMVDGGTWLIPSDGLNSQGIIKGTTVSCVSVAEQIRDHCEFAPRDSDREAMELLSESFGFDLPSPFAEPGG